MNLVLGYDTETTGLPDWKTPSEGDNQPHIVQLAAQLYNADTRAVIQSIDLIVKPDGWEIPDEVADIHGITNEMAHDVGVSEIMVVEMFLQMWGMGRSERVAYNKTFDQRIIRIATKRLGFNEDAIERWAAKDDHHCSMRMAQKHIGGKNPNLVDAYKHFTGKELENAHSAMADTIASMDVYWAIKDLEAKASD